jgi:CRISPR-associated exonuclease Cas4
MNLRDDDETGELSDWEVPISAIEHWSYCPRQCALIHVEQTFEDNLYTIRGRIAHERVDTALDSSPRGVRAVRSLPLWSDKLGLRGRADLVEFRSTGPYPVEYKVGVRRGRHADLQVCAEALCLEDMLGVPVPRGAVFYHGLRRRIEVAFDDDLRLATLRVIDDIRAALRRQDIPPAPNDSRCRHCSLINACLPWVVADSPRQRGLQSALFQPILGVSAKEGGND